MEFPRLVYKKLRGKEFEHVLVNNEEEYTYALKEGWFGTVPEALDAGLPASQTGAKPVPSGDPGSDKPPTRAEMEAKAKELGISFQPNIGDKKLLAKIEIALGGRG